MKFYEKLSLALLLKVLLDFIIGVGAIVYLVVAKNTVYNDTNVIHYKEIITFGLYIIGGVSLFVILFYLRRMINSLIKVTPFIWDNVKSLYRISIGCFIISACYIVNFIINNQYKSFKMISIDTKGVHTDVEPLIFFFAGFFILILSQVFKQAVQVKEENDLTV